MQFFDKDKTREFKREYQIESLLALLAYGPPFLILKGYWVLGFIGFLFALMGLLKLPMIKDLNENINGFFVYSLSVLLILNGLAVLKLTFEGSEYLSNIGIALLIVVSIVNIILLISKVKPYIRTRSWV